MLAAVTRGLTTMLLLAVFVAACAKKIPPPPPPPPPDPPAAPAAATAAASTGSRAEAGTAASAGAADGRRAVCAEDAGPVERGDAARRRAVRLRRRDDPRRPARHPAEERGLPAPLADDPGLGRRTRRLARHQRVQPGPRRSAAPTRCSDYLVSLGVAGDRMVAVSKGEEAPLCTEETEGVLGAQPPRALRLYGQVNRRWCGLSMEVGADCRRRLVVSRSSGW